MKILHISDIHNDFEALDALRGIENQREFDLTVCCGDIAGNVLTQKQSEALKKVEYFLLKAGQ